MDNSINDAAISDYLSWLQLRYDCETIHSLVPAIIANKIIVPSVMPYFALTAYSFLEMLPEEDKKCVPYYKDIENLRLKVKIFEDKYGRSERMIINVDYLQNEIFKSKLKFSFLNNLNIHYNLGLYTNKDKVVVGNTQYFHYLLQDNRFLKDKLSDLAAAYSIAPGDFDFNGQVQSDCYWISRSCSEIIKFACDFLKEFDDPIHINIKNNSFNFYYADYNTNTSVLFSRRECDKGPALYLLHILSTINFLIYVLDNYQLDDYGWWLKINYATYYNSIEKLISLREHFTQSEHFPSDLLELLNDWDLNNAPYINGTFRNYVMHPRFWDPKTNTLIISHSDLDKSKPLFGFVETCFNGMSYNDVKTAVIAEMHIISDKISKWFNSQSLNIKPLK